MPGIEPGASYMQSMRSTTELHPLPVSNEEGINSCHANQARDIHNQVIQSSERVLHSLWFIKDIFELILGGLFYFFENAFFRLFIPYCKKYVEGEIVLVTGAANGIEKLIAKELGHHRATLVLWDINSGTGQDSQRIKIHFLEAPANLVDRILRVNVAAHFWTYKAFLPALLQRNHGHLVCVACHGGLFAMNGLAVSCLPNWASSSLVGWI
ncbi:short-chain dehydrogenase/reductase family 16C member 6-like [Cyprinus carpio]|uniref:Short-chain dehydrogenase/reductase family 16C member 6-like n=1 Tax=Cyprinus carpio TaxID=7962 RepID=A0A9Q9Z914_CYPCA|nr:short-chain dehydrogenase/reductase family 16C member 6-like [Cyprinus carpio]